MDIQDVALGNAQLDLVLFVYLRRLEMVFADGQHHGEGSPLSLFALTADGTMVQQRQVTGQGESQAIA